MFNLLSVIRGLESFLRVFLAAFFILCSFDSSAAAPQKGDEDISSSMERVNVLRARGEFQQAIEILNNIIKEYSASDQVLRYAYNQLIFSYQSMGEMEAARAKAREALERFPDLKIETPDIPPSIDQIYNELRKEMFGSLKINKPEDCNVFLMRDSLKIFSGMTPLEMPLIRVGSYTLEVTKSGYHDYVEPIDISPDKAHILPNVPLEKNRSTKWWLLRTVPVAFAGALVTYFLWPEESTTEELQPLSEPPAPPAW